MAEPVRRHLRPARRSGLTSPDPVRTRLGRTATPNPVPEPGTRTSRRTGERQDACVPINPGKLLVQESTGNDLPEWAGGSRLSARGRRARSTK